MLLHKRGKEKEKKSEKYPKERERKWEVR